jgi:hypothetical protein
MDEERSLLTVAEGVGVYNIKHRAFYFSKEIVLFVKEQKV